MKVIVCGSRRWTDSRTIWRVLERLADHHPEVEIIHGAARGADTIAGEVGVALGFKVTAVPAQWEKFGKAAGPMRNKEMLGMAPDLVYAFRCRGESNGTDNMIKIAKKAGVAIGIYWENGGVSDDV